MSGPLSGRRVVVTNWRCPEHSLAGGAERYAWEFSRALTAAGARVDLVTARERHQPRREARGPITLHRGGGRFGYYAYAAAFLWRNRRAIDAVVDAESGIPEFSPLWVGRDVPVVLVMHHVHQDQFATHFPRPIAWVGRMLEGRAMPRVYAGRRALAVSESTRDEMIRRLNWADPVDVLVNGADMPLPVTVEASDTVDRIVVLGRLARHKRVDLVIRAVAALQKRRPALHLDVVGSGPEQASLEQLVAELGVEKAVTFHGYVTESDKAAILAGARLHICASDAEGWGQVVIEAASYGVPTVARRVPGLRGSVRPDETGWLIDEPGRLDLATTQALLTVAIDEALSELQDDLRRDEIATQCRTWARTFSWEQMHAGAVRVITAAINGR